MGFWKDIGLRYNANCKIPAVEMYRRVLIFFMLSCAHRWVFAIGLLAVLVVFIAPSVDLPATVLSAQQNAQCIMLGITLLRVMILFAVVLFFHQRDNPGTSTRSVLRLHPLLCTFLC